MVPCQSVRYITCVVCIDLRGYIYTHTPTHTPPHKAPCQVANRLSGGFGVFALKHLPAEACIQDTLTYVQNSTIMCSKRQDSAMPYLRAVGPMDCIDNKTGTVNRVSRTHNSVPGTIMSFKTGLIGLEAGDELVSQDRPFAADSDSQRGEDQMLRNSFEHIRVTPTFDGDKCFLSVVQNVQDNPDGSGLAILEQDPRQIRAIENVRQSVRKIDAIFVIYDKCRWPSNGAAQVASLRTALDQCKCHHGTLTDDIVWTNIDQRDDSLSWPSW